MLESRYLFAASIGLLVTGGLLYLMQLLVNAAPETVQEAGMRHNIGWIRLLPEEHLVVDTAHPVRPAPPAPTPPDPRHREQGPGPGLVLPPVTPPAPTVTGPGFATGLLDGPLVPVIIVSPEYPVRAATQGLEGQVTVRYDVTESGVVANVVVLESSHKVFEAAAVQAAYRFRYKPRIVDGVAQETRDLRNRFVFRMDE